MHNWKPWEEYADANLVDLPIEEPPCKHCKHWKPQSLLDFSVTGQEFGGVRCCWLDRQRHDFSCYKPREAKDPRTSPPTEWHTEFDRSIPVQTEEQTEEWAIGTELDFWLTLESFNAKSHKLQTPKPATPTNPQALDANGKFVDAEEKTEKWSIRDECWFWSHNPHGTRHTLYLGKIESISNAIAIVTIEHDGTILEEVRDIDCLYRSREAALEAELDFWLGLKPVNAKSLDRRTNPQTLDTNGKFIDAVKWQPIETAPKDGTIILGWCRYFFNIPRLFYWKENQGKHYFGDPYDSEDFLYAEEDMHRPTHWLANIPPFPTIEDS